MREPGTVSAADIGAGFRRGWYGTDSDAAAVPALRAVAGSGRPRPRAARERHRADPDTEN
ncbi:hypothetical protein [Streptomyces tendae]|uniref:hypothetical protein n=1 Tax=Streptomyces tendae TaxID=1932 RepID=UPI00249035CE|nr:hypothetical protein [Streptomyces tendae]